MFLLVLFLLIAIVVSYLLGSINFAVIISNLFEKKDVREMGSGNAGMTNVLRNFGPLPGILTFVGDALKAILGVYLGMYVFEPIVDKFSFVSVLCLVLIFSCLMFFKKYQKQLDTRKKFTFWSIQLKCKLNFKCTFVQIFRVKLNLFRLKRFTFLFLIKD